MAGKTGVAKLANFPPKAIGKEDLTLLYSTNSPLPLKTSSSNHPQDPSYIQGTFSRIARRYDLANHVLSMGLDYGWRDKVARLVASRKPSTLLDLATGSGDLALTLAAHCPETQIIAGDFCLPMLREAQKKKVTRLVGADGMNLPFAEASFDALTVAFGLRNMSSYAGAVAEFYRTLRPHGLLIVLDFSMPGYWLSPFYRLYLRTFLPYIAGLLTGDRAAYDYLGESIEAFPRGAGMLALLENAGFKDCSATPLACGIVTLYQGNKSEKTV